MAMTLVPHMSSSKPEQGVMDQTHIYPKLSDDIWYFITRDYLVDTPTTIASLSLTCRLFHYSLRFLKFRSVSIRLNNGSSSSSEDDGIGGSGETSSPAARGEEVESSAERFAEKLRKNPEIIQHIQGLWIREGEDSDELPPAMGEDDKSSEQNSICYVLTRPYSALKHIKWSTKHIKWSTRNMFSLPSNVILALDTCFSRPCLSEVSYLAGGLPAHLVRKLHHINTFNMAGIEHIYVEKQSSRPTHCAPLTLRIWGEPTIGELLNQKHKPPIITLERLTTLIFTSITNQTPLIMKFLRSSSSTLANLKIFFYDWRTEARPTPQILDPKLYSALSEITLGFNLSDTAWENFPGHLNALPYERLEWILEALSIFSYTEDCNTTLKSISIYICIRKDELIMIESLPWELFSVVFSLDSLMVKWPTLLQLDLHVEVAFDEEGFRLTASQVVTIEQTIKSRLAGLLDHGLLRLFVQGSEAGSPYFDSFLEYATPICSEPDDQESDFDWYSDPFTISDSV